MGTPWSEAIVNEKLTDHFNENPSILKHIVTKITDAARARIAAKKARELTRRKGSFRLCRFARKNGRLSRERP